MKGKKEIVSKLTYEQQMLLHQVGLYGMRKVGNNFDFMRCYTPISTREANALIRKEILIVDTFGVCYPNFTNTYQHS